MSIDRLKEYNESVVAGVIERVKPEYNLIRRMEKNPKSLRAAIDATCFHCVGGTGDHMPDLGWRKVIATCTSFQCPLIGFRPYTSALGSTEEEVQVGEHGEGEGEEKGCLSTA